MKSAAAIFLTAMLLIALFLPLHAANNNVIKVAQLDFDEGRSEYLYIHGNKLYLSTSGDDGMLHIINIDNPEQPFQEDFLRLGNGSIMTILEDIAYIACSRNLLVVDLNNENQQIIGSCRYLGGSSIMAEEGFVYLLQSRGGIGRINVEDPENPFRLNNGVEWEVERPHLAFKNWINTTRGIFAVSNAEDDEDRDGNVEPGLRGLARVEFDGGNEAHIVQTFNTANPPTALAFKNDILFTNGGFYDVSRVNNPVELYADDTEAVQMAVDGDYLYYAQEDHGILIMNVSDPENPQYAGSYREGEYVDIVVQGDYIFVADEDAGLKVYRYIQDSPSIDVSPARHHYFGTLTIGERAETNVTITNEGFSPLELPGLRFSRGLFEIDRGGVFAIPPGEEHEFTVTFQPEELIEDGRDTLIIESNDVDGDVILTFIGVASNVLIRSELTIGNNHRESCFTVVNNVAFTLYDGITAVSLENPDEMEIIGNIDIGGHGEYLDYANDLLYVLGRREGLQVVDISDPTDMRLIGALEDGIFRNLEGFTIVGTRAVIARSNFGDGAILVDIEDPENMSVIGRLLNENTYGVESVGNILFTLGYSMRIWDFGDPDQPELLSILEMPRRGYWGRIVLGEEVAYISGACYDWNDMIDMVDLSDLENPRLVGELYHHISGSPIGLEISGRYLSASTSSEFAIFDLINPLEPTLICEYQPNHAETFLKFLDGGLALGGNSSGNYKIYDFNAALGIFGEAPGKRIDLDRGWNLMSLNITPDRRYHGEDDGADIMQMAHQWRMSEDYSQLIIMKDMFGSFYSPEFDFNNIPFWNSFEAYWVKMAGVARGAWDGETIDPQTPLDLHAGWNLISYLPEYELDMSAPDFEAIAPIIDHVVLMKDGDGHFAVPAMEFSSMPPMHSGQGYILQVDNAIQFVYPEPVDQRLVASQNTLVRQPQNTSRNMSLMVALGPAVDASDNLVVKAYSPSGRWVGAGSRAGVAIWGDDPSSDERDGLLEGEAFNLQLVNDASGQRQSLNVQEVIVGNGLVYETDGFTALEAGVKPALPSEFSFTESYPNPFNSTIRLTFNSQNAGSVNLSIFDLNGRLVETIVNAPQSMGAHTVMWNAESLPSGLYLARLECEGKSAMRKLMLLR